MDQPINEKEIVRVLENTFKDRGAFKVQFQGPEGYKTKWLDFPDWLAQHKTGTVNWIPSERTVLPDEFIIELDPTEGESQEQLKTRMEFACAIFRKIGLGFRCDFSGNKSWHIHSRIPQLLKIPEPEKRKKVRIKLAEHFFSKVGPWDSNLFNEKHQIRISGARHPKSGQLKVTHDMEEFPQDFEIPDVVIAAANKEELRIENMPALAESAETPAVGSCNCMDHATKYKLQVGNRQQVWVKNFVGCSDSGKRFAEVVEAQNDPNFTAQNAEDWRKYFATEGKKAHFNCLEMKKTLAEEGNKILCVNCPYYMKHYAGMEEIPAAETKYGKFRVRPQATVFKLKEFYDQMEQRIVNGALDNRMVYKIYSFTFGVGNAERYIVELDNTGMAGEGALFLKPLSKERLEMLEGQPPTLSMLAKMTGVKKFGEGGDIYEAVGHLMSRQTGPQPVLYESAAGVPEEDLLNLTNEQCREIVDDFLTMGCEVDGIIKLEFLSDFLIPNPRLLTPDRYMPYNPHSLCYTFTTKVGKTSIASRTSLRLDKATTFALFGGGTADSIRVGDIEKSVIPVRIDELQEDSQSNKKNVLSYMETGYWAIGSGFHSGKQKKWSYASLHFMGNPVRNQFEDEQEPQNIVQDDLSLDLLIKFISTLSRISDNYAALGSRLGFVIFLDNIQPVGVGSMFDPPTEKVVLAMADGLRKLSADNFTRLYLRKGVIDWLNQPYEPDYLAKIRGAMETAKMQPVKEFFREYPESFKHLRGKAFKCACTEYLSDIILNRFDEGAVLAKADEYYAILKDICADSFFKIANISSSENSQKLLKHRFDSNPLHVKILIYACMQYGFQGEEKRKFQSEDLKKSIAKVAGLMNCSLSTNEILKRFESRLGVYSKRLNMFGVSIVASDPGFLVFISDFEALLKMLGPDSAIISGEPELVIGGGAVAH